MVESCAYRGIFRWGPPCAYPAAEIRNAEHTSVAVFFYVVFRNNRRHTT